MTVFGGELPPYPDCPGCGQRSTLIIGPDQAFCTNPVDEACRVLQFDPSLPDGGASNPTFIEGPLFPGGTP